MPFGLLLVTQPNIFNVGQTCYPKRLAVFWWLHYCTTAAWSIKHSYTHVSLCHTSAVNWIGVGHRRTRISIFTICSTTWWDWNDWRGSNVQLKSNTVRDRWQSLLLSCWNWTTSHNWSRTIDINCYCYCSRTASESINSLIHSNKWAISCTNFVEQLIFGIEITQ